MSSDGLTLIHGKGNLRGYMIYRPGRIRRTLALGLMIVSGGITAMLILTFSSTLAERATMPLPDLLVSLGVLLVLIYLMAALTALLYDISNRMFIAISREKLIYHAYGIQGRTDWRNLTQFETRGSGPWQSCLLRTEQPMTIKRNWLFYVMSPLSPLARIGGIDRVIPVGLYLADMPRPETDPAVAFCASRLGTAMVRYAPQLDPNPVVLPDSGR